MIFKGKVKKHEKEPFNPQKKIYINLFTEEEIILLLNKTGYEVAYLECFEEEARNSIGENIMCLIVIKTKDII